MNSIKLSGTVLDDPKYSHESYNEKFYDVRIAVMRESGNCDFLNCIVSEFLIDHISAGSKATFIGEIRTKNMELGSKRIGTKLYVFVQSVREYEGCDNQIVEIDGYICKEPVYRKTPLGRDIADLLIASNRRSGKSDYIPCIAWGRNALRMSKSSVGENVIANGRLQSREYTKKYDDGTQEIKTTYEVSLNYIENGGQQDGDED